MQYNVFAQLPPGTSHFFHSFDSWIAIEILVDAAFNCIKALGLSFLLALLMIILSISFRADRNVFNSLAVNPVLLYLLAILLASRLTRKTYCSYKSIIIKVIWWCCFTFCSFTYVTDYIDIHYSVNSCNNSVNGVWFQLFWACILDIKTAASFFVGTSTIE